MRVPRHLLRSTITVENYAGSGARGATYDAPREVRAAVQPSTQLVASTDGRDLRALLFVITRPEEDIPVESRVTYEGQRYRVAQSNLMPDDRRPTHREMQMGRLG